MRVFQELRERCRIELMLLAAVVLLGAFLRLHQLGQKSLWLDEIINAGSSITENVLGWGQDPLHIVATHLSMAMFGSRSEFVVRFPSALAGILCIPAIYWLGKSYFSRAEGLVGACLLAVSPLHLRHSQEARHYAFFALFSILSLLQLDRMMKRESRKAWIGFVLATALNLLTHKFALSLLLAEVLVALVLILRPRLGGQQTGKLLLNKDLARQMGLALAFIALLYVPSVLVIWRRVFQRGVFRPTDSVPAGMSLSGSFFAQLFAALGGGPGVALYLYLGMLFLGLLFCVKEHRHLIALFILALALPLLVLWVWRPAHFFDARYLIYLLPLHLLLIAKGLVASGEQIARFACCRLVPSLRSGTGIASTSLMILAVTAFAAASTSSLQEWYQTGQEDWRGVAAYLEPRLQEGDVVLCDGVLLGGGGDSRRTQRALRYYLDSRHPGELILKETEIPGKMTEIGDSLGQVWGVVYRGWRQLKPAEGQSVVVADFHKVSVVRLTDPAVILRDNSVAMLGALMLLMPQSEALTDLEFALGKMGGASLATSHVLAGDAYMESGDIGSAKKEYLRAIEIDPNLAGTHVQLAGIWKEEGRLAEALDAYRRALERKPDWGEEPWFLMRLGNAYVDVGDMARAKEAYRKVLELDPGHATASTRLGELPTQASGLGGE